VRTMRSAYLGNEFTISGFALSIVAAFGIVGGAISYQDRRLNQAREHLITEYELATREGKEHYLSTFNIKSERTGDNRDCSFFGVDLDSDGQDDLRRMRVPLQGRMSYNEYFDLRNNP